MDTGVSQQRRHLALPVRYLSMSESVVSGQPSVLAGFDLVVTHDQWKSRGKEKCTGDACKVGHEVDWSRFDVLHAFSPLRRTFTHFY